MGMDVRYLPMDYGQAVDWAAFAGGADGTVEAWVLDFSLPADDFRRLRAIVGAPNQVWIDHHVTAIEALGEEFGGLPGRRGTQRAACLMTWEYCSPGMIAPLAVRLIGDRDVWAFEYGDMSRYFHEAFWENEHHPSCAVWERWLSPAPAEQMLTHDLEIGEILYKSKVKRTRAALVRYGRVEKLHDTDLTVLTVNYPGSGDLGEAARQLGHSVLHCYHDQERDGRLVRVHSLYSGCVDVGHLAQERGGGGHKNASGWVESLK
jgi:oligoribonuclease NrnB/cAMP/cGMP phosphodiesterase (DHH superfamily)